MTEHNDPIDLPIRDKLNLEAAQIRWHELQTFFAAGQVIWVAAELNLLDVGTALAADDAAQVKPWVEASQVRAVTDDQAAQWHSNDATLWGLVIRPFVLVQDLGDRVQ